MTSEVEIDGTVVEAEVTYTGTRVVGMQGGFGGTRNVETYRVEYRGRVYEGEWTGDARRPIIVDDINEEVSES